MAEMFEVLVNIGELFSVMNDFTNDKKTCKLKSNTVIQQLLRDRFLEITGFTVEHRKFLSITKTYVNKYKKNKYKTNYCDNLSLCDWFENLKQ